MSEDHDDILRRRLCPGLSLRVWRPERTWAIGLFVYHNECYRELTWCLGRIEVVLLFDGGYYS